jgi:thiol-disulfide isomerase/thioredoxin
MSVLTNIRTIANGFFILVVSLLISGWVLTNPAAGQKPTLDAVLGLSPLQKDVDYQTPDKQQQAQCEVADAKLIGQSGWILLDANKRLLRRFVDTDDNRRIDQWCYYSDGIEVYRDIDSDGDNNADTFLWTGTSGIRKGIDKNGDFKIDAWERISAEEVTSEAVKALSENDTGRFELLLATDAEIDSLELGEEIGQLLKKRATQSRKKFAEIVKGKSILSKQAKWIHFGGTRPSLVPNGTEGSKRDLVIYENVVALVDDGGKNSQLAVGTLIQVGQGWRMLDVPEVIVPDQAPQVTSIFFELSDPLVVGNNPEGISQEMQQLIGDFQAVEEKLENAKDANEIAALNAQRADVLEKMVYRAANAEERLNWARQFTETIIGAYRMDSYPAGMDRIEKFLSKAEGDKKLEDSLKSYVKFRWMSNRYSEQVVDQDLDINKIQSKWQSELTSFINDYPKTESAADAMLDLGFALEFDAAVESDETKRKELDEKAVSWYSRLVKDFPNLPLAAKAAGAVRRMNSVGQRLELQGTTVEGKQLALSDLKGSIVIVHYWATDCNSCLKEMEAINKLLESYASRKIAAVGINTDANKQSLEKFLKTSKIGWPTLYEEGGLDGRLATDLGVLTLPTMLLLDREGKVVSRSLTSTELEDQIKQVLKAE